MIHLTLPITQDKIMGKIAWRGFALLAAIALSGCDQKVSKVCDLSKLSVGDSVEQVYTVCGKPDEINYYRNDPREQWVFGETKISMIYISLGHVVSTQPYDPHELDGVVRFHP